MFEQPYEVSVPQVIPRALKQFGYDLFRAPSSTFAPVTDVPVGPDFILGPEDSMTIFMWGLVENVLSVTIDRNGNIFLPKAGTLRLAGLRFGEAEIQIKEALAKYFKKFEVKVVMRDLHTIKVFVVGEVVRPGGYTISSLSTISNALYVAGGPSKQGTMRTIRLMRDNKTVITLDLYDFLLKGDKTNDLRLETGDTIFVPPIGPVAAISGMVKRPAVYELKGPTRISQLIEMAAGLVPMSYLRRVQIERFRGHQEKVVTDLDVSALYEGKDPGADIEIKDGDFIKVFPIDTMVYNRVRLEGAVKYPGDYELKPNLTLSQLLTPEKLLPQAHLEKVELIRLKPDFTYEVLYVNLRSLLQGDLSQDIALQKMDRIVVSTELRALETVTVSGEVKRPGTYTIVKGEKLSSVIRRAGGFTSDAYPKAAVFTRKTIRDTEKEQLDKFLKAQQQALLQESAAYAAAGQAETEAAVQRQAVAQRQQLLTLLSQQIPLGRMAIRLAEPEKLENTPDDILLTDGDTLFIAKRPSSVLVLGSVYNQSAFLHKEGENYQYYLERAGGLTREADGKGIYMLKADGSAEKSFLKMRKIEVGDTIVVPVSTEAKYRPIPLARDIATIIGHFAVTLGVLIALF
ncbi:MAG: SLBB domain-containing protein [bacterium]